MDRGLHVLRCVFMALFLAAGALAVAASLAGCKGKTRADLVIVSPHPKTAEDEFIQAFRAWHREKFGRDVTVEPRDLGGSSAIRRTLENIYRQQESSGIDVLFGAGGPVHVYLAEQGLTQPVRLPDEVMAQLPETISGVRQYDADGQWYGAALSCFGIVYNARLLRQQGLALPKTWDDLAAPAMYRKIETADATQSGSAAAAYELIIQSAPDWPAGWGKLLKVLANSKKFADGAGDVVRDVAFGEVLAGSAIDFYAYTEMASAKGELGFVRVAGTTAFTPDPICMLKNAPHPEMARRFIEFVLSERGQVLWCLPAGAPGGPKKDTLYRQPVRRDVYAKYAGRILPVLGDPFKESGAFRYNQEAASVRIPYLLGPLMKAAAIDSQSQLAEAWKVVIDAGLPADLLKELTSLPADLADEPTALATARKLADPDQRAAITGVWQRFFRDKYERIIAAARGR